MPTPEPNLTDLITLFYDEYLALYGDEELASVAAAATINDILADRADRAASLTPVSPDPGRPSHSVAGRASGTALEEDELG